MEENSRVDYISFFKLVWSKRKVYYWVLPITFVLSCLYIVCIPRTYTSEAEIVLESSNASSKSGALGSLASSFGFDLSNMESSDAITPMLYPDLLEDNNFIASLFGIQVRTADNKVKTDYFTYLKQYTTSPIWTQAIVKVALFFAPDGTAQPTRTFDPYNPTKKESKYIDAVRSAISLKVDKKTGSITVTTMAQDPMVAKIIADSVCGRLQNFIIEYRTKKAKIDMEYYKDLTEKAKQKYEKSRQVYGSNADANLNAILTSVKSKNSALENEMNINYDTYSTLHKQLQAAIARVQERTPVFMKIKGASVAVRATSPKRVIFVLVMLVLAFVVTSVYVLRDVVLRK